ncbi:MAG: hypothetical protein OEM26_11130, partial [Saprospiraceae bacterium]|nr:hypothetical protein [Saprospiraceae bacterium]
GHLYIASVNGQEIVVMNKNNGKIIDRITEKVEGPDDLVFSPDGLFLYWTDILTGFVRRLEMNTGAIKELFVAPGVNPITFSGDGERLFVALDFLGDGLYELDPELNSARPIIVCSDPNNPFCLGFLNSFNYREEDGRLYGPLFAANLVISVNVDPGNLPTSDPYNDADLDLKIVAGLDGAFENPAAAKFGPDRMLYVLDQAGEVWKVNPDGVDDKTLITTLQPGLDNMTFDSDGTLYMTNNDEGWVAEILSSGQARIISPGGMIMPQGLAVLAGLNNQDVVFEADLFNLRQFNGTSGQQESIYKGFLVPEGPESLILPMNVSSDGEDLIVSSFFSSGLQVWNPQDGVKEDYSNQVGAPIDAVRVNSGDIIVSDLFLGGVVRMSDNSNIAPPGLYSGLATDGETVWAADWANGDIVQIDFDGGSPSTTVFNLDLEGPEGLAVDQNGNLLVVEVGASRLSRVNDLATGDKTIIVEGLEFFEGGLSIFPPFWFFDGVAVGPSGDIYVTGGGANVIYRIPKNKVR